MANHNISDIIEAYLKDILAQQEEVEIRRTEVAELFNCVPSQINYVINTRFTVPKGYLVKSKRGGGGYIRIIKVKFLDESDMLDTIINIVGNQISANDALAVVQKMYEEQFLTKKEANLMLAAMDRSVLNVCDMVDEEVLRAKILVACITSLRYEE